MILHQIADRVPEEMQQLIAWMTEHWRGSFEFRWHEGVFEERCIDMTPPGDWRPSNAEYWLPKMQEATRWSSTPFNPPNHYSA